MKNSLLITLCLLIYSIGFSQVGINEDLSEPHESSILDIKSTTKGFLPPRMPNDSILAINNPKPGLMVFSTSTNRMVYYDGANWREIEGDALWQCNQPFFDSVNEIVYETIQIGAKCWMGKNLNIGVQISDTIQQSDNLIIEKYCYENNPENCNIYGGLYQWDELMQYEQHDVLKGICPEGWHLPTASDWLQFIDFYGNPEIAGAALLEGGSSGFNALFNGQFNVSNGFSDLSALSTFWSSSKSSETNSYGFKISNIQQTLTQDDSPKSNAYGVRCIKGKPNNIDKVVVIIDTLVYELVSDSIEIIQGIYRYNIIGKRESKDVIIADNIIVGLTHSGYLRKVLEVQQNRDALTLITIDALLEDVFVEGEFGFMTDSLFTPSSMIMYSESKNLAKGVSISQNRSQLVWNFNNVVLYQGGGVSAKILQGSLSFDPNFHFDFRFDNNTVKYLAFLANNATLNNSINLKLSANAAASGSREVLLGQNDLHLLYFTPSVPPIPIWIVITRKLIAAYSYNFRGAISVNAGYTNNNTLTFGAIYQNNAWQTVWNPSKTVNLHPISWSGTSKIGQGVQLIPKIEIKFYNVIGPYFSLPLWLEGNADLKLPELDYSCNLNVGLNANIGAKVEIFGKTLQPLNANLFGFGINLYNAPHKISIISGDNQISNDPDLPEPLVVKVTDNIGATYVPALVHFEVIAGGGTLSAYDVWTNINGLAQTNWTLGEGQYQQVVNAYVRRADGKHITNSPVTFIANLTCEDVMIDPRDGQLYPVIQIGNNCWMNKNLNFAYGNSFCYDYLPYNCDVYGRLYDWYSALNACPPGWRLPSVNELSVAYNYMSLPFGGAFGFDCDPERHDDCDTTNATYFDFCWIGRAGSLTSSESTSIDSRIRMRYGYLGTGLRTAKFIMSRPKINRYYIRCLRSME